MPVWYEQAQPLIESGRLVMLGVIQEQHAERCRLFQQWKQMQFPIVQDVINSNGIAVVPVYVGIDEHGYIRKIPRDPRQLQQEFVDVDYSGAKPDPAPAFSQVPVELATVAGWRSRVESHDSAANQLGLADALVVWERNTDALTEAIGIYRRLDSQLQELAEANKDESEADSVDETPPAAERSRKRPKPPGRLEQIRGQLNFRLGAANRILYEQQGQVDSETLLASVTRWEQALSLNPNQYIYRRRIEQYGPRLKKPYSFYDWVAQARDDIQSRGESPVPLPVEPNGAELAERARTMIVESQAENPDPAARIILDDGTLVQVHHAFVPTEPKPGEVIAVHINFQVRGTAKWNHETTPLKMWVEPDPATASEIKLSTNLVQDKTPYNAPESRQPVSLSFEMEIAPSAEGPVRLNGFALFNICETRNGQCIFRRRNFTVEIPIQGKRR